MRRILTLILLLAVSRAWSLNATHFTITRISAPYFIVDGNTPASITKCYVGFEITNNSNSGVTYTNLKFAITSIGTSVAGQNYAIISPASGIINVGTLSPGQSRICYYYISYPANITPQATFNVQLSDNTANSKTTSFVIRNRSSISANAGGTATQSISSQDLIGGIITDDITYAVGNSQNGDEVDFQVAVSSSFDPTKIMLLGTQVISSTVPGVTAGVTDSLYYIAGNGSSGATVTIRWTFRITGYNYTNYLLPCAGATSGSTNYKYALNTSLGAGTPVTISAAANPLTITKTSDKLLYGMSSAAVFTVTISNPGAYAVTVDKIVDQLPTGFTYQSIDGASQVTAANSTTIPLAGATGTITFEGGVASGVNTSYYVPAGGSIILKYNAISSSTGASNLLTNATDYIGTTLVGTAANTVSVSFPLPVTLMSFRAAVVKQQVQLDWTTSGESNSSLFEIERKTTGNTGFARIGQVVAAGLSTNAVHYTFIDSFPATGLNEYRLRMVDRDQRYRYSDVVAVEYGQTGFFIVNVYPNPFADHAGVSVYSSKDDQLEVVLFDMGGKAIMRRQQRIQAGTTTVSIDQLAGLLPGTYLLKLTASGITREQKLLKSK